MWITVLRPHIPLAMPEVLVKECDLLSQNGHFGKLSGTSAYLFQFEQLVYSRIQHSILTSFSDSENADYWFILSHTGISRAVSITTYPQPAYLLVLVLSRK